jgi:hypothetical protein
MPYVIGVDSSTTATKAIVWDREGRAVAEGRAEFALALPRPGWHEQDAEDWWRSFALAVTRALGSVDGTEVEAICLTHQRETFACLDEHRGPSHPLAHVRGHRGRDHVGQEPQIAALAGTHALGDRDHELAGAQQRREALARPLDADRVDPAQDDLGVLEGACDLLEPVRAHRRGELAAQPGVHARRADRVDDLAVEVRSHQADVMAVVGERYGKRRAHHARSQDDNGGHGRAP